MTVDKWKLVYGYLLLLIFAVLICVIGLGKVTQQESFGLDQLVGGLLVLAGAFGNWCFQPSKKDEQ